MLFVLQQRSLSQLVTAVIQSAAVIKRCFERHPTERLPLVYRCRLSRPKHRVSFKMIIWIRPTVATLSGVQPNVVVYHCIPEITSDKTLTYSPPIGHRDPSVLADCGARVVTYASVHIFSLLYWTQYAKDYYKRPLI